MTESKSAGFLVGIDVGGTNTDGMLLSNTRSVVATVKTPTTGNVHDGIEAAIRQLLDKARLRPAQIDAVMIGTTQFVNAVVERSDKLAKVAVLRLCGPSSHAIPPFAEVPAALRRVLFGHAALLSGGCEYDGSDIAPLDEKQLAEQAALLQRLGLRDVVVAGVFSPASPSQELRAGEVMSKALPGCRITLSHRVASSGLLERENAAILNAAIKPLAQQTIRAFRAALDSLGFARGCPLFLSQNDGTLLSAEAALQTPVLTFASGPTNSMRGAAFLSGLQDCIVCDIGGTTSDLGVLVKGFPRPSSTAVSVGGVRTNFRMPQVLSIGLGGGSIVRFGKAKGEQSKGDGKDQSAFDPASLIIGPDSVGFRLTQEALVFGGSTLTMTDIAVAGGLADIGDKSKVSHLDRALVSAALALARRKLEAAIDAVKTSSDPVPVLLVGGGCVIVDARAPLKGTSRCDKPRHFDAANAVGAAISQVSATVDPIVAVGGGGDSQEREKARASAVDKVKQSAVAAVLAQGADPKTVSVVDVEETPLSYMNNSLRVRVKAVGDLSVEFIAKVAAATAAATAAADSAAATAAADSSSAGAAAGDSKAAAADSAKSSAGAAGAAAENKVSSAAASGESESKLDDAEDAPEWQSHEPVIKVNAETKRREWLLSEHDVAAIAEGAGILGTGGGGSPYIGSVIAKRILRSGKAIRVVSAKSLPEDATVVTVGIMGAPSVLIEKIPRGDECVRALRAVEQASGRRADALMSIEIGGLNSVEPLSAGALTGVPVIDYDGVGRAFPELQMFAPMMYGLSPTPTALCDEKGNTVVLPQLASVSWLEKLLRTATGQFGNVAAIAFPPMTPAEVRRTCVPNTLSQSWRLGRCVLEARRDKRDPVQAIVRHQNGRLLFTGKVTDVSRSVAGGFNRGCVTITEAADVDDGSGDGKQSGEAKRRCVRVDLQNEFLVARLFDSEAAAGADAKGKGTVLASAPDLITIVDSETGQAVMTETVRYGLHVSLLALPCSPVMRTERALQVVGPAAFGYHDVEYRALDKDYVPPASLLD